MMYRTIKVMMKCFSTVVLTLSYNRYLSSKIPSAPTVYNQFTGVIN